MKQEFSKTQWVWIIPAIPLVLMLLLVAVAYLFPYRGKGDPYFGAGLIIGGLATLVGLVMLVALLTLRFKHKIRLAQTRLWLSMALTCLDLAVPIGVFSLILYALSQGFHH